MNGKKLKWEHIFGENVYVMSGFYFQVRFYLVQKNYTECGI